MEVDPQSFAPDVLKALQGGSLAIFAGAGLSKAAGFVDWKGLLRGIARDLNLDIDKETDLISIAQYNVNKINSRSMLNQKIIEEFNEEIDLTENHRILARLPIHTYWTTNYDDLLERSLKEAKRIADVKHTVSQLNTIKPRRDATIYKMHGDSSLPSEAVLTKDDYEVYFTDKSAFVNLLSGDLVSKLFIFIGFSFTDPNLDYILSRVRIQMRTAQRHHYYFIKHVALGDPGITNDLEYAYAKAKQDHFITDLKRFKLIPVIVDQYSRITTILAEIETEFKRRTIFISGSAEEYGALGKNEAQDFIHKLSARLIRENYRVVNGFGWGVGSAVINGALDEIYRRPEKYGSDLLIVKPFPQFATGDKTLEYLWGQYRRDMQKLAGVSIYLFGNIIKSDDPECKEIVHAKGMRDEFEIAREFRMINIPIKMTGYMAGELADQVLDNWGEINRIKDGFIEFRKLSEESNPIDVIEKVIQLLRVINK